MQKIEYFTCICLSVLFFSSKKGQIKFYALLNHKIHNKRELQNIATNHPADIDYKDFMRFIGNVQVKLILFLTIYTTLPADNPLRFRKNLSMPL